MTLVRWGDVNIISNLISLALTVFEREGVLKNLYEMRRIKKKNTIKFKFNFLCLDT